MMKFNDLVDQHQAMQSRQASDADAIPLAEIQAFLEQARAAGRTIEPIQQREQLRAILRYWGAQIFDRTDEYPAVHLAPYDQEPQAQQTDTPPEPAPSPIIQTETQPWTAVLKWLLPSILALAIVFLLIYILFFRTITPGDDAVSITATMAAINPTSSLVTPSPTLASPDSDGDGLTDAEEAELGTDANNPDSDGDGLADNVDPNPALSPTNTPTARATVALQLPTNTPTLTPSPTATFPPDFTPSPTLASNTESESAANTPIPTPTPLSLNTNTLDQVRILAVQQLANPVQSAALSANGRFLATGTSDGTIQLFDTRTGRETAVLTAHEGWVRALAFSPDGRFLASGGNDSRTRVFDVTTGQLFTTFGDADGFIFALAFDASGQWLAAATGAGAIQLNNIATGASQMLIDNTSTAVTHLAWHPTKLTLAAGGDSGSVTLWAPTGEMVAQLAEMDTAVASLSWAAAGQRLTATSSNSSLYIWDTATFEACVLAPPASSIQFAATADTGVIAANTDAQTQLTTLNLPDCTVEDVLPQHRGTLTQLALSSELIATGDARGSVRLWPRDGSLPRTLAGSAIAQEFSGNVLRATAIVHQSTITHLLFTPDTQKLISIDDSGIIGFWHVP